MCDDGETVGNVVDEPGALITVNVHLYMYMYNMKRIVGIEPNEDIIQSQVDFNSILTHRDLP